MATDVNTQFFSHLNGLKLTNTWGDLIRLLDKCLVNGITLPVISSATVDSSGHVTLVFEENHNAVLFQIVQLSGFAPSEYSLKYRVKGVPNATTLVLKSESAAPSTQEVTGIGTAKLASLGYEIIFRDTGDVKRVYRAKNPTPQHPFIRVDESIASATGTYAATYAKSAMFGLIEDMTHIDDYQSTDKQQLPFLPSEPSKNWSITAKGAETWNVVRGWSKWYYALQAASQPVSDSSTFTEFQTPSTLDRYFTLFGDRDAFYLNRNVSQNTKHKILSGCGLYESALTSDTTPNWFLMSTFFDKVAGTNSTWSSMEKGLPLARNEQSGAFMLVKYAYSKPTPNIDGLGVLPNYMTGNTAIYSSNNNSALQIPIYDSDKYLRGTLKHVNFSGRWHDNVNGETTPMIFDSSMYLWETMAVGFGASGGVMVYLGELE